MSELTDFHVFWGAAMEVAEKLSASIEAEGAEAFARNLYDAYVEQGAPKNKKKWLSDRLENEFLCLNERPKWIGEPSWLYHQEKPMVFLNQFSVAVSAQHLKEKISLGDTIFVFGSRHSLDDETGTGWTVVYRTVAQDFEGNTIEEYE